MPAVVRVRRGRSGAFQSGRPRGSTRPPQPSRPARSSRSAPAPCIPHNRPAAAGAAGGGLARKSCKSRVPPGLYHLSARPRSGCRTDRRSAPARGRPTPGPAGAGEAPLALIGVAWYVTNRQTVLPGVCSMPVTSSCTHCGRTLTFDPAGVPAQTVSRERRCPGPVVSFYPDCPDCGRRVEVTNPALPDVPADGLPRGRPGPRNTGGLSPPPATLGDRTATAAR